MTQGDNCVGREKFARVEKAGHILLRIIRILQAKETFYMFEGLTSVPSLSTLLSSIEASFKRKHQIKISMTRCEAL